MKLRRSFAGISSGKQKGSIARHCDANLQAVLHVLAADEVLEPRYRGHALTGYWKDHRGCHIKPDLLLIYRKTEPGALQLVRLGSHAELGF